MSDRTASHGPARRPLDLRASLLVLVLCVIWGAQQVIMKSVAGDVAPVLQLAIRFAAAAVFFGIWVARKEGVRAFADGTLPSGLCLGALFSLEFVFVGESVAHTTAAHTIVFLYSAPIFTALGLQMLPEERLGPVQWLGIAAAFIGIVIAFLGPGSRPAADLVVGDSLALLGGVVWGLSNVVLRRCRVGGAATPKTVLYQVGMAGLIVTTYAILSGQAWFRPSRGALLAIGFQTLMIAIGSYLIWFWLLRLYLTSRLMLASLLTPLFGVGFGAVLLHEPIDGRFATGAALVLLGIFVVGRRTR